MRIVDLIEKKKHGFSLSREEIEFIINAHMKNEIEDYQISALLMSIYFKGLNIEETTDLTRAMINSGDKLDLSDISNKVVDKHSTGGVGDKITLIFIPLMAAAGVPIAKLSGRGLGHTGGTIDKLESIPDFNVDLPIDEFKTKVKENGLAIASQTQKLTPADGKWYALRDVTSTVDIIPLIAASVVSKKIASGANQVVLDGKYGSGAFMKTLNDARKLAYTMLKVAEKLGKKFSAVISNMNEPLGRAVGNSLEIIEVIDFLKGINREHDLEELTLELGGVCLVDLGYFKKLKEAKLYLKSLLQTDKPIEKFRLMISSQNGNANVIDDSSIFQQASYKLEVKSPVNSKISFVNAEIIAKACKLLGAGRSKKSDSIDYSVGIYLNKKTTQLVIKDETIATIYANDKNKAEEAMKMVLNAYKFNKFFVKKQK